MQLGLIGFPLKNGFSKAYFENKFRELNMLDSRYENYPFENVNEFKNLLENHPDLNGLSVTIPHKQNIISYINELDQTAEEIGAVNCIKITKKENGVMQLKGYNTDAFGFEQSLLSFLDNYKPQSAIIIGIGGAAKAVIYILKKLGIQVILVGRMSNQNEGKIAYEDLSENHFKTSQLIVNCSPVGMHPNPENLLPIPYEFVNENHYCFDLIYNPDETRFLEECRLKGAKTKNGLEMLNAQAERAFEIWSE
jgi:shikimate dehydrogenase